VKDYTDVSGSAGFSYCLGRSRDNFQEYTSFILYSGPSLEIFNDKETGICLTVREIVINIIEFTKSSDVLIGKALLYGDEL